MQPMLTDAPDVALRMKNTLASATVVIGACAIYASLPNNTKQMLSFYGTDNDAMSGIGFLALAALTYIGLLAIYFLAQPDPQVSKSLRAFRVLGRALRSPQAAIRGGIGPEDRLAVLTTLLKTFFGPMMVMALMLHCMGAWANGSMIVASGVDWDSARTIFDRFGFWFLMRFILFVDVLIFTVGYLVESPRLKNEIRSVDPTLIGWAAALLCYPPFNIVTGKLLGAPVSDFPQFDNPDVHIALNLTLLTLMALYTSASVSLGLKASNLTHRGIVSRGLYGVIRHPAYTCKNMAWWIGSAPLLIREFGGSPMHGLQALGSVAAWSALYVLRALTEEDHLKRVDGEYAAYAARVRYRFIPGVI
jgi:hypothetical protein